VLLHETSLCDDLILHVLVSLCCYSVKILSGECQQTVLVSLCCYLFFIHTIH